MVVSGRDIAVVIGASNVSRGLSKLVEVLASRHKSPLDLFVTAGHGRSYGVTSLIGPRSLPSVLASGLWRDLDLRMAGQSSGRFSALITDVGNDLIYGFPPETVAEWVSEVARRLVDRGAKLAIVRLPLASVARASELRYLAIRAAFSPWLKLNFAEMKQAAAQLDSSLQKIAKDFGATIIDQPGDWYGFDVIHIRRRQIHELWHATCDAWSLMPSPPTPRTLRFDERIVLHTKGPEVRSIFGIKIETTQPCVEMNWIDDRDIRVFMH